MSNILRRPMFRGGGKVSSYGNGIASGLAKPKRGLVDEPGGYAGFSNLAQFLANQAAGTQTGGNILSQTVGKVQGPTLSPQMQAIENRLNPQPRSIMGRTIGQRLLDMGGRFVGANPLTAMAGLTAATFVPVGIMAAANRPKTVEALQYMKEMSKSGVTDETAGDNYTQYAEEFKKLNDVTKYTPLKESKVGLFSSQEEIAKDIEDRDMTEFEKQTKEDLTANVRPGETAIEAVFREGKEKAKIRDAIENPPEPIKEDIQSELEKDKELFKELLGADKARSRDIGDMLASASASFLGTGQVKEGFAEFMANQAKSGPSRTEKLNQTAAGLAINDYIAGRRSKESLDELLAKTKFNVDYSLKAQAAAKDLTTKSWVKALGSRAEELKMSEGKNEVIKSTLFQKFEKPAYVIMGFENKPYIDIKSENLKVGFNIVPYNGGKIIIEKFSDGSVKPRIDLPVS
jgi:hypothetical protein